MNHHTSTILHPHPTMTGHKNILLLATPTLPAVMLSSRPTMTLPPLAALPFKPKISVEVVAATTTTTAPTSSAASASTTVPFITPLLAAQLVGDVAVAATVTFGAAPFLTVIDKALVQRSSNANLSLWTSARASVHGMLAAPLSYVRSPTFLWMWATYAATYSAANMLRTLTSARDEQWQRQQQQQQQRAVTTTTTSRHNSTPTTTTSTAATTLFLGTTVVNTSASLVKDRAYARMFGGAASSSTLSVPKLSYAFWMTRDLTVIGSSFILPAYVAPVLEQQCDLSPYVAGKVAQIGTPVVAQLVAGPLHYVGLDVCNRPLLSSTTTTLTQQVASRVTALRQVWVEVVAARMLRIVPGYGIAGVYNTSLRSSYQQYLLQQSVATHSVDRIVSVIRAGQLA